MAGVTKPLDSSQYPPPDYGQYPPPADPPPPYSPPPQPGAIHTQQRPPGGYAPPPGPANHPAYPPGSAPASNSLYATNNWAMEPTVFSPEFNSQYTADYSGPSGSSHSPGFLPPNTVPNNEVTEADSCVCVPDKSDMGCCYVFRLFISTLFHLAFLGSLVALLLLLLTGSVVPVFVYVVLGLSYLLLVIESFCAYDLRYLKDIKDGPQFAEFMRQVHSAMPSLTLHVECYHYETRYRTEYYTDSQGRSHSRTVSERVKVVTHRESEGFRFNSCQDLAPPNINIEGRIATRVVFFRTYRFADDRTRAAFESQSMNIRRRNRNRDVHMSYYELFSIPGFTERMLAFLDKRARHCLFNPFLYVLASFLLLTWPYRWWFRRVTAKTSYTFIKQLKL